MIKSVTFTSVIIFLFFSIPGKLTNLFWMAKKIETWIKNKLSDLKISLRVRCTCTWISILMSGSFLSTAAEYINLNQKMN